MPYLAMMSPRWTSRWSRKEMVDLAREASEVGSGAGTAAAAWAADGRRRTAASATVASAATLSFELESKLELEFGPAAICDAERAGVASATGAKVVVIRRR